MKKRNIIIAMVLAMAMTTVGGATVFAADEKAEGNDYTIAYVPTTMNNPFWTAMMEWTLTNSLLQLMQTVIRQQ